MAIIAREQARGNFKLPSEDLHRAVCDMVVDLGIQPGGIYNGQQQPDRHKVYIRWALPDERIEYVKDGVELEGPMVIGKFYTVSLSEMSNLRPDLENWRGRRFTEEELDGFDISSVLGKSCMVQVQHDTKKNGEVRAKVTSITRVPKGVEPAKLDVEGVLYDPDHRDSFDVIPEWLQKFVSNAVDFNEFPKDLGDEDDRLFGEDSAPGEPEEPPF